MNVTNRNAKHLSDSLIVEHSTWFGVTDSMTGKTADPSGQSLGQSSHQPVKHLRRENMIPRWRLLGYNRLVPRHQIILPRKNDRTGITAPDDCSRRGRTNLNGRRV
jgi:hypothetical protein